MAACVVRVILNYFTLMNNINHFCRRNHPIRAGHLSNSVWEKQNALSSAFAYTR